MLHASRTAPFVLRNTTEAFLTLHNKQFAGRGANTDTKNDKFPYSGLLIYCCQVQETQIVTCPQEQLLLKPHK